MTERLNNSNNLYFLCSNSETSMHSEQSEDLQQKNLSKQISISHCCDLTWFVSFGLAWKGECQKALFKPTEQENPANTKQTPKWPISYSAHPFCKKHLPGISFMINSKAEVVSSSQGGKKIRAVCKYKFLNNGRKNHTLVTLRTVTALGHDFHQPS